MQTLIDTFLEKIEVYDDEIYIKYTFDSSRTMPVALSLREQAQEKDVGNSPRPFIIQKICVQTLLHAEMAERACDTIRVENVK